MGELLLRVIYCFSYRIYTVVVYAHAYTYARACALMHFTQHK